MNTDKYGLPVQSNGDAADQLQRVGMIAIGQLFAEKQILNTDLEFALKWMLQLRVGEYRRFYETTTTNDVTADQLIPVMAYWTLRNERKEVRNMHHVFAQNTRKQGEPDVRTFPDFMLLRALPLLVRNWIYIGQIIGHIIDILLVFSALSFVLLNRGFDDVDDNNTLITLVTCYFYRPTFLSKLALKIYIKFRAYSPEYALRRYHRTEAGGNPEIAELWIDILNRIGMSSIS